MFQDPQAEAAVFLANERFYRAFSEGNYSAMSELWAQHVPVACFHPTAPALIGREAVLQSFRQILRGAPTFALRCEDAVVTLVNDTAILTLRRRGGRTGAPRSDQRVRGRRRQLADGAPPRGPIVSPAPAAGPADRSLSAGSTTAARAEL